MPGPLVSSVRNNLAMAEKQSGAARRAALVAAAKGIDIDMTTSTDKGRVQLLHNAVLDLSKVK
jgi:hypothetical protein